MKRILIAAIAAGALAWAATAAAALQIGVDDPNNTGCVTASYNHGTLHLTKNCTAAQDAAGPVAGAVIDDVNGSTFQSASFTLASASQCQGGSPRFDIVTTTGLFFAACNSVTPTINSDGTATYTFTPSSLVPQISTNTAAPGTITFMSLLIDVNGTADITKIFVNGNRELPVPTGLTSKGACKHGGYKRFSNPSFKNQGKCISYWNHVLHDATHPKKHGK